MNLKEFCKEHPHYTKEQILKEYSEQRYAYKIVDSIEGRKFYKVALVVKTIDLDLEPLSKYKYAREQSEMKLEVLREIKEKKLWFRIKTLCRRLNLKRKLIN